MKSCKFLSSLSFCSKFIYFRCFVSGRRAPFNTSCNLSLVEMNSFSFCLGMPLFLYHIYRITFLERVFLADSFIVHYFENVILLLPIFWAFSWEICQQPNVGSFVGCHPFFLAVFTTLSLILTFEMSLWCVSNMVFLHWDHLCFLCIMDLYIQFLPQVFGSSQLYFFK